MAQTQLFTRKAQIHLIEEASQDTYLAPAGTGAAIFLAYDVSMTIDSSNWSPMYIRSDFLKMDEVPGMVSAQLSFTVPLKGSGSAGTAPEWAEALKACGYYQSTDATGATDSYYPLSTFDGVSGDPGPSYSLSWLENGVRYAIAGAFGNVVFNCNVGEPATMAYTFSGAFQAVADDGLESPTYNTTSPPAFMGATWATNFGGAYTDKGVESFTLDTGNTVTIGRDVNKTLGVYGARITDRKSTGSFDPEMVLVATHDYYGTWTAGTTGTIATGTVGGTAGNKWSLSIARAVCRPPEMSENNGIRKLTVPFAVSSATTDVEGTNADITLTLT